MSYRPRAKKARRAQPELSVQYPAHFLTDGRGYYRCLICNHKPEFASMAKAMEHEDEIGHVNARRQLDRPPSTPPSPVNRAATLVVGGPESLDYVPSVGYTHIAYARAPSEEDYNPTPGPSAPSTLSAPARVQPEPAGASLLETGDSSRPDGSFSDWYTNFSSWSESADAYCAIPGPVLPSDPPETIYDLCGGAADPGEDELSDEDNAGDLEFEELASRIRGESSTSGVHATGELPGSLTPEALRFAQSSRTEGSGVPPPLPMLDDQVDPESWWPFSSKQEALMSIMTAFPRAIFSGKELDVVRWFAGKCGVGGMPNPSSIQTRFETILTRLGLESRLVQSKLGNYFAINSLKSIIANEMSNPLVRNRLVFYPQDNGRSYNQAANGARWREEVDASLAAPMVRRLLPNGHQDYFVHEPFLASVASKPNDSTLLLPGAYMPTRYFEREGDLFARAHPLLHRNEGYVIDGDTHLEIPLYNFLLPLPEFRERHSEYGLPAPDIIHGILFSHSPDLHPWTAPIENRWRKRANGKMVRSLPMWIYCDDTSGNSSKKWNKHNSFLFTLAGLPRSESQLPYNVHFLATSNIASPLEMLEEIAGELHEAYMDGVDAYDCMIEEDIVVIPWVYAVQGDNPMQSELSSHIGLTGKFFCRVCHVRGKDKDRAGDCTSEVERVSEFMKVHRPRHSSETVACLQAQEEIGLRGTFSVVDTEARKTGVKDKYLSSFLAILKDKNDIHLAGNSQISSIEFLHKLRQTMPERLINPALFIPELDVNQDTPVEVLHVILLGIVKYFWRDAVSRQTLSGKEVLKARIDSLDVSGLALSPLRGATLVQYAKSLTGRDFRAIVQIAPAILFDLIPAKAYDAWRALSSLAPLIFQQEIEDIEAYLPNLTRCINLLLEATVQWSPQWFNKPKFHILLHLPEHIRRFGPASLFATETFESYNFVIRLRSIHSNRHAPSHDIARSFSRLYAIRFLVSGGWVTVSDSELSPDLAQQPNQSSSSSRRQAGHEILKLTRDDIFMELMGMSHFGKGSAEGKFALLPHSSVVQWSETQASRSSTAPNLDAKPVKRCQNVTLENGDVAHLNGFGLVSISTDTGVKIHPVKILEIIAVAKSVGSSSSLDYQVLGIVVQLLPLNDAPNPYQMPRICSVPGAHPKSDTAADDRMDPSNTLFITPKELLCVLATFHNCAQWKCPISRSKVVMQERQETALKTHAVQHHGELSDLVINVASLRSASIIQQLQATPEPSNNLQTLVQNAVTSWKEDVERLQQEKEQRNQGKNQKKPGQGSQRKRKRDEVEATNALT